MFRGLLVFISALFITSSTSKAPSRVTFLHYPKSLQFYGQQALDENSLLEVFSAAFGVPFLTNKWEGLHIKNPYNFAKAVVIINTKSIPHNLTNSNTPVYPLDSTGSFTNVMKRMEILYPKKSGYRAYEAYFDNEENISEANINVLKEVIKQMNDYANSDTPVLIWINLLAPPEYNIEEVKLFQSVIERFVGLCVSSLDGKVLVALLESSGHKVKRGNFVTPAEFGSAAQHKVAPKYMVDYHVVITLVYFLAGGISLAFAAASLKFLNLEIKYTPLVKGM